MSISERLEAIFKSKNITAKEFAEIMNVQRSAISHIMSGRNKPSIDFLERFIEKFPEYSVEWLISGRGFMLKKESENNSTFVNKKNMDEPKIPSLFDVTDVNIVKEEPKVTSVKSEDAVPYAILSKEPNEKTIEDTIPAEGSSEDEQASIRPDFIEQIIFVYADGTFKVMTPRKK